MKTNKTTKFTYTKKVGDVTEREVFVLSAPGDCVFGIDVSEFDDKDKEFYLAELDALFLFVKDRIKDIGLAQNYRLFKHDKISNIVS